MTSNILLLKPGRKLTELQTNNIYIFFKAVKVGQLFKIQLIG